MFAEFIDRPISGQFPEKHFGPVTTYVAWVLFTDKDYQQWVGSFPLGWEGFASIIINLEVQDKAFVVAGGNGYFIDISRRELVSKDKLTAIKTAIAELANQQVIFSDGLIIQCIDFEGKNSILFDKYYFDEIELLEVRDNTLYARYWYYQGGSSPFSFEMNLLTKEAKDSLNEERS
jgi:hypothetical protein